MIELRESGLTVDGESDYSIESVICVDKNGKEHRVPIKRFEINRVGSLYHRGGSINIKSKCIGTIGVENTNEVTINAYNVQRLVCQHVTLSCLKIDHCYASKHNAIRTVKLKREKRNPFESPEREVALHHVLKSFSP